MYLPKSFSVSETPILQDLIEEFSFGTLVLPREGAAPEIAHLPFLLERERGERGTLLAHVARANPVGRLFGAGVSGVAIFEGPHAYVSPRWYGSREDVPTWNYMVVHAHGVPEILEEPAEVVELLGRLARKYEGGAEGAWSVDEVPGDRLEPLTRAIVAFRMRITLLEGKFKLGQNRELADRRGAIAGLRREGGPMEARLADAMERAIQAGDG